MPSRAPRSSDESAGGRKSPQLGYATAAGLGLQFAMTFLVTGAIGWWLDGMLGTRPWLMIVGIFLGAAGAFTSLVYRVAPPAPKTPRPTEPKPTPPPPESTGREQEPPSP